MLKTEFFSILPVLQEASQAGVATNAPFVAPFLQFFDH
jgi:hypothetical protein